MLHGKCNSQYWLTNKYEKKRLKGLRDRAKLTDDELLEYHIEGDDGGGRTNEETYEVKQSPFPMDTTIRKRQTIDIRRVRPELGEISD